MASISIGVPTHPASIFKMAAIKMITDFEVRTLKMIEITDFNDLSVTDKSTSTEGVRTTDPQFECPSALPTELKGNSH